MKITYHQLWLINSSEPAEIGILFSSRKICICHLYSDPRVIKAFQIPLSSNVTDRIIIYIMAKYHTYCTKVVIWPQCPANILFMSLYVQNEYQMGFQLNLRGDINPKWWTTAILLFSFTSADYFQSHMVAASARTLFYITPLENSGTLKLTWHL